MSKVILILNTVFFRNIAWAFIYFKLLQPWAFIRTGRSYEEGRSFDKLNKSKKQSLLTQYSRSFCPIFFLPKCSCIIVCFFQQTAIFNRQYKFYFHSRDLQKNLKPFIRLKNCEIKQFVCCVLGGGRSFEPGVNLFQFRLDPAFFRTRRYFGPGRYFGKKPVNKHCQIQLRG